MSFYRTVLAAVAAAAIASPVFADDTTTTTTTNGSDQTTTTAVTTSDASSTAATTTKININKATAKELMKVKGLSKSNAKAIVAYRKAHGDFQNVNDLTNIKGLQGLKSTTLDQLTVE